MGTEDVKTIDGLRSGALEPVKATTSTQAQKRLSSRLYGISPKRFAELTAASLDPELGFRVCLSRLYTETVRYLDCLVHEVHEGKRLEEAANFVRWLRFSGVLDLLTRYAPADQNFPSLDRKLTDLISECGEHFRGGRVVPKYDSSDIAEINRKLDALLASSARRVVTIVETTAPAAAVETESETRYSLR